MTDLQTRGGSMHVYWCSSIRMTFGIETDGNHIITKTAPIAHKFIGQSVQSLDNWMRKQGGYQREEIA